MTDPAAVAAVFSITPDTAQRMADEHSDTAPPAELALMREKIKRVREAMVEEAPTPAEDPQDG